MVETNAPTPDVSNPPVTHPTDRIFSVLAHMSSFLGYIIPLGQFLGPYTVQLLRGSESEAVLAHTREVLNFQLTILGVLIVGLILVPIGIGWLVIVAALAHAMAQTVRGARAASLSESFQYPWTLRLLGRSPAA